MRTITVFALTILVTLASCVSAQAAIITYDVSLHFDPNSSPTSSLGPLGPGTITGTITIDTNLPATGPGPGNLVGVDLTEKSNNGTYLSALGALTQQSFTTVTPYGITFLWSPVTEYPASSIIFVDNHGETYERVAFFSQPIFDSIQVGPGFQFDFKYTAGGDVVPGNFDSTTFDGFNQYLFGTVTPQPSNAVPEPSSALLLTFGAALMGALLRLRRAPRVG